MAGAAPGMAAGGALSTALGLLVALALTHLLMLGAATVISVYKPWGKTPFARRPRFARQPGGNLASRDQRTPARVAAKVATDR